jgi:hypothetical protein
MNVDIKFPMELFYPIWRSTAVIVKVRRSGNSAPLLKIGNRTGQFGTVSPLSCLFFYFLAPDLLTATKNIFAHRPLLSSLLN